MFLLGNSTAQTRNLPWTYDSRRHLPMVAIARLLWLRPVYTATVSYLQKSEDVWHCHILDPIVLALGQPNPAGHMLLRVPRSGFLLLYQIRLPLHLPPRT